jgi:hypothetical protein
MPISHEELKQHVHQSGFIADERLRTQALEIIWNGIQLFRENKTKHGIDTREDRQVHRLAMKGLRLFAQILGVPFRSDAGDKRL